MINQDKIRTLAENETYKYLGILEADTFKQVEMKTKIQKEYLRRTRKLLETKLSSRNLIKGINTWAVALVRYSGPFLKRTRDEIKWTKEQENLWPCIRHYIPKTTLKGYMYQKKKKKKRKRERNRTYQHWRQRWRIHTTIKDNIQKHDRGLIKAIWNDTDNTMDNRMTITRKQKWEGKQLYGRFKRLINNISHDKTCTWLRKGNFKRETESLLIATQKKSRKNQSYQSENR